MDNSRSMVEMHSGICEDIAGNSTNISPKYLNVKAGRLLEEYHVGYENKAKHSGRQVKLTYMLVESTACEVTEE